MNTLHRLRTLAADHGALLAILAAISGGALGATLAIDDTETSVPPRPVPVVAPNVVAVDGADKDSRPDDTVVLSAPDKQAYTEIIKTAEDLQGDLVGDEAPLGPVAKLKPPFAAESVPGCRTRFLTTNWSHRAAGVTVRGFGFHFTGGPDRPGSRSEVDGLTAYGNRPAARVSWHFNMDKDGNCDYNVPIRYKAWTIGDANSGTVNIEVHGVGSGEYMRPGGYRQLARIVRYTRTAFPGIKLQLGALRNCQVTRGGFVTHWMGGPCSGGHTDIRPHEITQVVDTLKRYLCDARCRRRKEHTQVHQRRKELCATKAQRAKHPGSCPRLLERNTELHRKGI